MKFGTNIFPHNFGRSRYAAVFQKLDGSNMGPKARRSRLIFLKQKKICHFFSFSKLQTVKMAKWAKNTGNRKPPLAGNKTNFCQRESWGCLCFFILQFLFFGLHSRNLTNWYQKRPYFKGSYLFQTIILGIQPLVFGDVRFSHPRFCLTSSCCNSATLEVMTVPMVAC